MSRINNNYSILPWYTDINDQDYRKWYTYGSVYPLVAPDKRLPGFQVLRETDLTDPITEFVLINWATAGETDIRVDMLANGLQVESFASYDLITYPGLNLLSTTTPQGIYYCRMSDGTTTWYSEVFCIQYDLSRFVELRYWHNEPFILSDGSHISYAPPFYNRVFLDTDIAKPEYLYEDEIEVVDGYEHVVNSISKKQYRFTFHAPEYLLDALRLVRQHRYHLIIDGAKTYRVDNILFSESWLEQGHLARVDATFLTDTVAQRIGYQKAASDIGDYDNTDYNDDYLK